MGGGKGDIDRYVAVVTPGKIIYEITGVSEELAASSLKKAGSKMPFRTKIVSREG